ncbi:cytochrome b5-like heme/steroid binding domain-containing protein [Umbelopsis sp. PMI_123]|nr:cytochrome b5-like heme/steroid binding domain-containing protein [Umbelopsis sp. PMI_123]
MSSFTYEQVAEHNTKSDLYMIIHNKVYNISEFVDEHPGGEEVLLDEGAKDATEAFEDVGHSDEARELLEKYFIGEVDKASTPVKPVKAAASNTASSASQGNPLRIIVPLLILGGWIYFRFFA